MLKQERHRRILESLTRQGSVVAADLPDQLSVSGHTVRRDLEELSARGLLQRVHGGAVARSTVAPSYAEREGQSTRGKAATAAAAVALLHPGQVAILDGGTTMLQLVDLIPADHDGTLITHSPVVAGALGRRGFRDVLLIGGTLDPGPMVAVGAETIRAYSSITADVCFLGIWSLHRQAGITGRYHEEAEVRRILLDRADRIVGVASQDKLGSVSTFASGPATALTHLATEPSVPEDLLTPFRELGITIVQ
jgi:DeoR/GlpR family transcriptional regulator of sugar metabolism